MASSDMPAELGAMIEAGLAAGREIRASWLQRRAQDSCPASGAGADANAMVEKSNTADLQTETDRKCEELVRDKLQETFPGYLFIGEEEVAENDGKFELTDAKTFVIDPIDGTTNFVHTMYACACLIALMDQREVVQGVIVNPIEREIFFSWKNGGAWVQQLSEDLACVGEPKRLSTSGTKEPSRSVVASDIGYRRDPEGVDAFQRLQRGLLIVNRIRGLRIGGCCGLGLANVASGRFDAYVELGSPYIWDYSAGSLMVNEAGGKACNPLDGGPIDWYRRDILCAATPELADEIVKTVQAAVAAKDTEAA